jgi:broad specificity polyphosphatase/5'/3'-nucleotidase SurE
MDGALSNYQGVNMSNRSKSQMTVAAAFTAALLGAPSAHANSPPIQSEVQKTDAIEPSEAATKQIEAAAQLAWWFPIVPTPPKWVEIWPEVTHVESIRSA